MKNLYIVYMHRNKINNKCYVGQTCQKPETRWGGQGQGYRQQPYFYRAIQKYGWDNFEHIILEDNIPENLIDERESFWAGYYHALAPEGYTLIVGSQSHIQESEEMHKKRSEASKKNWQNPEYREKIIQKRKEEWLNPKVREICLKNLVHDGSTSPWNKLRKCVQCVETGIIYSSMREAEKLTGIKHNNISLVCSGQRQTAGGFHWRLVESNGGDDN